MKKKVIILVISLLILNFVRYASPFNKKGDINELRDKYGINTDLGFQYGKHASIIPFMSHYFMNTGLTIDNEYCHYYVYVADYKFLLRDIPSSSRIRKDSSSKVIDEYYWGDETENHSIIYTNNFNTYSLTELPLKKGVAVVQFWLSNSENQPINNEDINKIKYITEVFIDKLRINW